MLRRLPGAGPRLSLLHDQRVRFVLVGGWNTAFGYLVFAAVHLLAGERLGPMGTLVAAYGIALPQAFATQKWIVFRDASAAWQRQFLRFSLVNTLTFLANAGLLALGSWLWPGRALVVQAAAVATLTIVSFIAHKYFSFAGRR